MATHRRQGSMNEIAVAIDPLTNGAQVMERSTDFDGWVVLFHVATLEAARKLKSDIEQAEQSLKKGMIK